MEDGIDRARLAEVLDAEARLATDGEANFAETELQNAVSMRQTIRRLVIEHREPLDG